MKTVSYRFRAVSGTGVGRLVLRVIIGAVPGTGGGGGWYESECELCDE